MGSGPTKEVRRLVTDPPPLARWPQIEYAPALPAFHPTPGRAVRPQDVPASVEVARPSLETAPPPLVVPHGPVHFTARQVQINPAQREHTILAFASHAVDYAPPHED